MVSEKTLKRLQNGYKRLQIGYKNVILLEASQLLSAVIFSLTESIFII